VTKELMARGYNVIAFAREQAGIKGKMGKEDTRKVGAGVRDIAATAAAAATGQHRAAATALARVL
jgi:hypothetical protein